MTVKYKYFLNTETVPISSSGTTFEFWKLHSRNSQAGYYIHDYRIKYQMGWGTAATPDTVSPHTSLLLVPKCLVQLIHGIPE